MTRRSIQTLFALTVFALVLGGAYGQTSAAPVASTTATTLPANAPRVPPGQSFTLAQARQMADLLSPLIVQAVDQTASQHATYESQRAPLNPTIAYAALNNTVAPFSGFGDGGDYSAYMTLETNGAQRYRAGQAGAQLSGAKAQESLTRLNVEQGVDSAYIALQVANAQLDNEKQVYGLVEQLRDLTQSQFQLGAGPQTSAIRADIALTQEEQNLIAAISTVEQARAALNVQVGREPQTPVDAAEALIYAPINTADTSTLIAEALRARPELASADSAVKAAHANVGLLDTQYVPNVTLGANADDSGVEVGLVMPLVDLGSIRGAVKAARETEKAQQAAANQTRLAVAEAVAAAKISVDQAREAVDTDQAGVLPQTQSLLDKVTAGYKLGANTILDVIDAQQTYRSTRSSCLSAIGSYNQALDQLRIAVGGDLAPGGK